MDVYGKNPKQNKPLSEFPVYHKYKKMEDEDSEKNGWGVLSRNGKNLMLTTI